MPFGQNMLHRPAIHMRVSAYDYLDWINSITVPVPTRPQTHSGESLRENAEFDECGRPEYLRQ